MPEYLRSNILVQVFSEKSSFTLDVVEFYKWFEVTEEIYQTVGNPNAYIKTKNVTKFQTTEKLEHGRMTYTKQG